MDKLQITLDQLKNYLGTGLFCVLDYGDESYSDELVGLYSNGDLVFSQDQGDIHTVDEINPICYRLSDLDKFIPELGFVPLEKLTPYANTRFEFVRDCGEDLRDWTFQDMQKLFQWHFWPFGEEYFEQKLVIDKMNYDQTT